MAVQEHWPARDVQGAEWFLPALFWMLSSHSPSPSLHPPAPLCSDSASLPRPSLGPWWQQMVLLCPGRRRRAEVTPLCWGHKAQGSGAVALPRQGLHIVLLTGAWCVHRGGEGKNLAFH